MSRFTIESLVPDGPVRVTRMPIDDARGSFTRLFCMDELSNAGWSGPVAQANLSITTERGAIRGLHFQHPPNVETKLVLCLKGAVLDVAVDVRANSAGLRSHVAAELSADNGTALLIPPGFAHGFQTLTDDVHLLYFHSAPYMPDAEDGLNPFDRSLGIAWPLAPTLLSPRDQAWPQIDERFCGVQV